MDRSIDKHIVRDALETPQRRVRLRDDVLKPAFDRNVEYLRSLPMDSVLYWFRERVGRATPGEPYRGHFEDNIKGQTAGLLMMGAANALRWAPDAELASALDEVVTCIDECRDADGYLMAIPREEFGTKEYPNYVRVWLTLGLIAAGVVGNERALPLLRDWQDWFNRCDELPIVRYLVLAFQGIPASTSVYFSPIGVREDLDVAVRTYQEDWRLAQFILRERDAIHVRRQPGAEPHPHGSEISAFEGYLDFYRATGNPIYLNAVRGAWEMYRQDWQHVGGGIVMIEGEEMSPGCRWLSPERVYNELCVSAYWIYLNQRLHRLFPDDEQYVAEIEKSIYNVAIANQIGAEGIRYHAYLDEHKDTRWNSCNVTCCAGQATRVYASLPEFIYSLAPNGVTVDMYVASDLEWECDGVPVAVSMNTDMPFDGKVSIGIQPARDVAFALRLRIPGWASEAVDVALNDERIASAGPGTYYAIDRTWSTDDTVSMELPIAPRTTRYEGADGFDGCERYAVECGPVLMGFTGVPAAADAKRIHLPHDPQRPGDWLRPSGDRLRFDVSGGGGWKAMPYFDIGDEPFTCFPAFEA